MTAPEIVCIELVARTKRPGSVRHWDRSGVLLAGTCRDCGELTPAEELRAHRASPGGRALQCLACNRSASAAYADTPTGAAKQRERHRRRVTEGRKAEQARLYRERHPGRAVDQQRRCRASYADRTPEQIAADRARLRPDGLKKCRAGHWSPFDAFNATRANPDGLSAKCREHAHINDSWIAAALPSMERRDTWLCVYCGEAPAEHGDHVEPKARGGADDVENLIGACSACNLSKNDRDLFAWRPDLLALVAGWPVEYRTLAA